MIRVVLDANVLVSAALARDPAAPSLRAFDERRFVVDLAAVMKLASDPPPPYPAVCRDPDDDYLVALARAALVDALVTGDRDLLELDDIGIAVITPRQLLEQLADGG